MSEEAKAIEDILSYVGFGIDGIPGCIFCHRFSRTKDIAGIKHADDCAQERARAEYAALVTRAETAEARYEKLTAIVQRIIAASDASDFECESEAIEEACAALAGDATGAGDAT